jgi:F-type H+-transporting ATPase subunit gamma
MSESLVGLRRKITSAGDLQSVVRTMKALSASRIGQCEQSVLALDGYSRTLFQALGACMREHDASRPIFDASHRDPSASICAVLFGSDQGLVGQFNDVIATFTIKALADLPGRHGVFAIGDRVRERVADAGLDLIGHLSVPGSVEFIPSLVQMVQIHCESLLANGTYGRMHTFHNQPHARGIFSPVNSQILPFDAAWIHHMIQVPWPTKNLPGFIDGSAEIMRTLASEYIFISLFRSCAESMASENESRLSAMERADRNIDELLIEFKSTFNRLRQDGIDEELFDVISGFEALVLGH